MPEMVRNSGFRSLASDMELFDHDEVLAGLDRVAHFHGDFFDFAVLGRMEFVLHLHGLDQNDPFALLHRLTDLDLHADHAARHRRRDHGLPFDARTGLGDTTTQGIFNANGNEMRSDLDDVAFLVFADGNFIRSVVDDDGIDAGFENFDIHGALAVAHEIAVFIQPFDGDAFSLTGTDDGFVLHQRIPSFRPNSLQDEPATLFDPETTGTFFLRS